MWKSEEQVSMLVNFKGVFPELPDVLNEKISDSVFEHGDEKDIESVRLTNKTGKDNMDNKRYFAWRNLLQEPWNLTWNDLHNMESLTVFAKSISDTDIENFARAIDAGALQKVTKLSFVACFTHTPNISTFLKAGALGNLKHLVLRASRLEDQSITDLVKASKGAFQNLEILQLNSNEITNEGLMQFSDPHLFPKLQELTLKDNIFTGDGIVRLMNAPNALPKLRIFHCQGNNISNASLTQIAQALDKGSFSSLTQFFCWTNSQDPLHKEFEAACLRRSIWSGRSLRRSIWSGQVSGLDDDD